MMDWTCEENWPPLTKPSKGILADVQWNVKGCKPRADQCTWNKRVQNAEKKDLKGHKNPRNWNIPPLDTRLVDTAQIGKLFLLYGTKEARKITQKFKEKLLEECKRKGVEIQKVAPLKLVDLDEEIENKEFVFKTIAKETADDVTPPMIIYIDPLTKGAHGQLKLLEALLQLRTQHVNTEPLERAFAVDNNAIIRRVVKQLNMKVGGVNHDLDRGRIFMKSMFIGYCVAHPTLLAPPGMRRSEEFLGNTPSIVGFSANCSPTLGAYVSDFHFQEALQELVSPEILTKRMRWMLDMYEKNRGELPNEIFVLREGLPKQLFAKVIKEEVLILKKVCNERIRRGYVYNPEFVVVAVKHSTSSEYHIYPILERRHYGPRGISSVLFDLSFTHQLTGFKTNIPKPLYEALEWTKRGANIFSGFRENHFALPRLVQTQTTKATANGKKQPVASTVDWEELTNMLAYMGKRLQGLRIKV